MRRLAIAAALCLAPAMALAQQGGSADRTTATAQLKDAKGNSVGTVTFTQHKGGVVAQADLKNLAPGWHAIHVHENGTCEPDFKAAGGHYNPADTGHGLDEGDQPHAGDLPNFHTAEDGTAQFEMMTTRLSLADDPEVAMADGARAYTVFDQNGSSVIIHSGRDDYATDPAGDSGDRIACGVIQK